MYLVSVYIAMGMTVQTLKIFTLYYSTTVGNIWNMKWKPLWLKQTKYKELTKSTLIQPCSCVSPLSSLSQTNHLAIPQRAPTERGGTQSH